MTWLIKLALVAAAIAAVIGGYTWWRNGVLEEGVQKERAVWVAKEKQDADLQASDRRQQRQFSDLAATRHIATVATLTNQLGVAREKIAHLSGRACLNSDTVSVLNAIGARSEPGGAPASKPTRAAEAVATDRDVSEFIATCRAWYGEISSQLNQILDIEDRRHPLAESSP